MIKDVDRYEAPSTELNKLPGVRDGQTPGFISPGTIGFSGEGNFGVGIPGINGAIPGQDGEGPTTDQALSNLEARAEEDLRRDSLGKARANLEKIPAQKSDLETFNATVKSHETEEGFHNRITVDGMGNKDRYK
ncbi:hypothetical protein H1S01_05900 [Heliobacterium chlorum]|uniref:Uncharacterized protein n=1 Tax=Heliobacterium chlorum TaxID=2698 RepID=A0ABR7T254_HELCL|nr:hypothetical protein [Heliobacterium chlorum]MBC9784045.1 hypothetical protein [Heliobacterium chlorum]